MKNLTLLFTLLTIGLSPGSDSVVKSKQKEVIEDVFYTLILDKITPKMFSEKHITFKIDLTHSFSEVINKDFCKKIKHEKVISKTECNSIIKELEKNDSLTINKSLKDKLQAVTNNSNPSISKKDRFHYTFSKPIYLNENKVAILNKYFLEKGGGERIFFFKKVYDKWILDHEQGLAEY